MKVKDVTLIGVFTALLLGGQIALSWVSGIEIVTVLFASFCYARGIKDGVILATIFSLIRCFIFGFIPNVMALYIIYYNLFAVVIGSISLAFNKAVSFKNTVVVTMIVVVLTILFTVLDNVITPLFYGYSTESARLYFFASLYAVVPQTICAIITMSLLFLPLMKLYQKLHVIKQ